mgnify:CR=1 FL=1
MNEKLNDFEYVSFNRLVIFALKSPWFTLDPLVKRTFKEVFNINSIGITYSGTTVITDLFFNSIIFQNVLIAKMLDLIMNYC